MTQSRIFPAVLVACALSASAGMANAAIAQCFGEAGGISFTDTACKDEVDAVRVIHTAKAATVGTSARPPTTDFAAPERARAAGDAIRTPSGRGMAGDTAMLKVAKLTMTSIDAPWLLARQRALSDSEQARSSSYWAWLVPMSAFRIASQ